MDRIEYEALLAAQTAYLERITPGMRFTGALLRRMHRDWLGGIYEWAGQYRGVDLAKGGFRWPPAFRVQPNMEAFEANILGQYTPCRPGPLKQVAQCIAITHAELLLIHPFRDGNARLARWLADLMALQANFPTPAYGFTGRGSRSRRAAYLQAVRGGYVKDYEPLALVLREAIERRLDAPPPR